MNIAHFIGNLTRDIEIRYTAAGLAIGKTAIATSRKFNSNGERKEEIMFMDIVFFGKSAESANQYLNKGSKIQVTGRITFATWTDNAGAKRNKHELVVETMEMIDTRTKAPQELDANANQGMPQRPGVQQAKPHQDIPIVHENIQKSLYDE